MTELKPCPFCGLPFRVVNRPWLDGSPGYEIEHVDMLAAAKKGCPMEMACYDTVDDAVKAVNTRAERTCSLKPAHGGGYYCSNCHVWIGTHSWCDVITEHIARFCPACGAKVVE